MKDSSDWLDQIETCIARFDLLRHPFYKAWSTGALTREDLKEYATEYYFHVASFPSCLSDFANRLEKGKLRQAVLANLHDEMGWDARRPHADIWLDFAEGMGAERTFSASGLSCQTKRLISFYRQVAREGTREEALAAFYVYESQVPRVSKEKLSSLRDIYGADERTCQYFILHSTADVFHAEVWKQQLQACFGSGSLVTDRALASAEAAARSLWEALDGIHSSRLQRRANRDERDDMDC